MNCQEALDLLYDIIDKEASEIDAGEVEEHLKLCRHCSGVFRVEASIQELIKERLHQNNPSPRLDTLKSNILSELDSIDRDSIGSGQERPPFFRLSTILALAASLVLVIGAAFLVSDFYRHDVLYAAFEKAHHAVHDGQDLFQDTGITAASMVQVNDNLQYAVSRSVNSFEMSGGRLEEILGTKMAHFVFHSDDDKCVSVFVADAASFEIPDNLQGNAVTIGGFTFYDHNCRGCRLVYHRIGNAIIITASSNRDVDLLNFVPGSKTI